VVNNPTKPVYTVAMAFSYILHYFFGTKHGTEPLCCMQPLSGKDKIFTLKWCADFAVLGVA
jgi:hypothetical protein